MAVSTVDVPGATVTAASGRLSGTEKIVQRRTCRRSSTLAKAKPAREVVVGLIASELHLVYLFG